MTFLFFKVFIIMEKQICRKCHHELPITDFYTSKNMKSGYLTQCKLCWRERHKNPENKPKSPDLMGLDDLRLYRLTKDDYKSLYELLDRIGYDTTKDIHKQFIDKWNNKNDYKMIYGKRGASSINKYLPDGSINPQYRRTDE